MRPNDLLLEFITTGCGRYASRKVLRNRQEFSRSCSRHQPLGEDLRIYLIAWMDQAAAFTTIGHARSTVVTASIDGIEFRVTIKQADIVELVAWVERVEQVASTSPGQCAGASLISEYSAYLSCF